MNDVTVLGGRVSKNVQNCVTSLMDDPLTVVEIIGDIKMLEKFSKAS